MSSERILVRGSALPVALVGAILARRWSGKGKELVLAPEREGANASTVIARPDHKNVHAELGLAIESLAQGAEAVPVLAVATTCGTGQVSLPFSPYGMARGGTDFHHFWRRAIASGEQPDLAEFSLALRLDRAGGRLPLSTLAQLPLEFGLRMDRLRYIEVLSKRATSLGAFIADDAGTDADLIVDCRVGSNRSGWIEDRLLIADENDIPGLEWQICVNAARRFLGLAAKLSDSETERREYSRLARAESARIRDFRALLRDPEPRETEHASLSRKIDLFEACGRIPSEDFEVFGQPEWLAALLARGIWPKRYDRLADSIPDKQLRSWLSSMQRQIGEITDRSLRA
ncbi:MAG: tryptophan 7-halogenase [Erythrobacter sp.]|nr:tryptophan 7-halogenase [Erythrobacter sp.]